MQTSLASKSILLLVANGVDEIQLTEIQRALTKAGAKICTAASEQGVVNSWHGNGWGHYFPVDRQIGETLGSDFDGLVLPGGERAAAKLKQNLHARRIINHFLDANKPVAAIGAGVSLLALGTRIADRTMAAPEEMQADLKAMGADVTTEAMELDANILSVLGPEPAQWVEETLRLLSGEAEAVREAA